MPLTIETERLCLRPLQTSDAESLFLYRSNKNINRYQGWIPETIEEVENFIRNQPKTINIPHTWFQLGITKKDTKAFIGDIGIHFIKDQVDVCEIGCTIASNHHHKGYAKEALATVVNYLFNDLDKNKITGSIDPRNKASEKLLQSIGMKKEAHHIKSFFLRGEWTDDVVYALYKEQ